MRVLFADDQLPWPTPEENDRTKAEIAREFSQEESRRHKDVDTAFAEDHGWFSGLVDYLEKTRGAEVTLARTFDEAFAKLGEPWNYDVAIIDLSWWGDYTLPQGRGARHNRGLDLLDANRKNRLGLPLLCLSQNFKTDFELMGTVLQRGAFPMPKSYDDVGYRAIYAALDYLSRAHESSRVMHFVSHAHADAPLALQWVRALQTAFAPPAGAILCTSAPGYEIEPGANYRERLRRALSSCGCVAGVWTAKSAQSQWCWAELGAAWGRGRDVQLLLLKDPEQPAPEALEFVQSSDLTNPAKLWDALQAAGQALGWTMVDEASAKAELEHLAELAQIHRP
ncbi:MAG: toll/interleukin-1 receptor domain-containing protein [Myxococcota bacterium]